jgi:chromosomal replication initiator protein
MNEQDVEPLNAMERYRLRAILRLWTGPFDLVLARAAADATGAQPVVVTTAVLEPIFVATARAFAVPRADLFARDRHAESILARAAAVWLARDITHASFPRLGKLMGRDHSTIFNAARKAQQRLATDVRFRNKLNQLRAELAAKETAPPQ